MQHQNTEYYGYILNFIEDYKNRFGESPSSREIGDALGMTKSTVSRYLATMRKNGMLEIENARNITLTKHKPMQEIVNAPFVGKVACGLPQYAEENVQELIPLPASYIGKGTFFVLEADGESMIDAGIEPGDLIVVRQQVTANPGDIVVALTSTTDSTATLKRYYPEPKMKKIRLHPENSEMEDQYYDEVIIQGVAIRVLKNVEQYRALNLHSFFQHGHYEIRCCNASLHAGEVRAQIVLALAISNAAMTKKYCSPSVSHSDNMRYSFRVWLLNLGLIGDEYKNCRTHLLKHLTGDIAWRHPEDGVAQRERLRQERIAAREQEQRNESPCDERVEPVSVVREEVGETPDENLEAAVSDCDDFEETEDEGMAMSM